MVASHYCRRRLLLAIRIALALWVLFVGSLRSPGIRHAHAGGEKSHHHHAASGRHHDLAGRRHDRCAAVMLDYRAVAHVHVVWFGIELILPAGAGDCADTPESGAVLVAAVPSSETVVNDAQATVAAIVPLQAHMPGPVTATSEHPPRVVDAARSILLCDAARHERSGVQLA